MLTRRELMVRSLGAAAAVAVLGRQGLILDDTAHADPVAIPPNAVWRAATI